MKNESLRGLKKKIKNMTPEEFRSLPEAKKDHSVKKGNFANLAKLYGFSVEKEFKFDKKRKFRADWKVSKNGKSVLVEYEGINSTKSGHTTVLGYTKDCEKYNLAQINGYKVLRYTMKNFCDVFRDLEILLF